VSSVAASESREAPSRTGRDIAVTVLTQAAVALGGLWLYRLLAIEKGAEGVASYSLVKQLVFFSWPVAMVGLQTAIPRYIALVRDRPGGAESYLVAALAVIGTVTVALCGLVLAFPDATAALVFGDADRDYLVVPLALTLVATVADSITYGYFRGRSKFTIANAVHVVGVAALPVILLVAAGDRSIDTLINLMAVGLLVCCAVVIAGPLVRAARGFTTSATTDAGRTLLNYGYRRVPGEIAAIVLFTVPAVLAAHYAPLEEVAWFTAGLYVLFVVSIAFQPIGLVFLPLLSRLCATDFDTARRYVTVLTMCAVHIAIFVTPQMILFADLAVRAWLGPDFDDAGTIIAITVAPAGVYVFNVVLRSALDAAAVTAYNARNNVISLAVAAGAMVASLATDLADPLECIAASFAVGVLCLGLLTLLSVVRVYGLNARNFSLGVALALALVAGAIAFALDATLVEGDASLGLLGGILLVELGLALLYVLGLVRAGVEWPLELWDRMRRRA
jgi:O-antigen/teichoic acid export membrane protein